MPTIVMTPNMTKIEGALKKKAWAFIEKLSTSDDSAGLHIEPINNSADPRVRTGRIDLQFRAVLFKVQGSGPEAYYVLHGVWNHDEAIAIAQKSRLLLNPVNGVLELVQQEQVPAPTPPVPDVTTIPTPVPETTDGPEAEVQPTTRKPLLAERGISLEDLTDGLGIDRPLAESAIAATSDDELTAVADLATDRVIWQGIALLEIAAGSTVAEVRESLGIESSAPVADPQSDDSLIDALKRPASRIGFSVLDDDELRRAIEDEDFDAWRIFLHPEQRRYVEGSRSGAFRLSGGAGTGKTVVLVHRARMLARADPRARIVLTTYTRNLANALKADLLRLDPAITLTTRLGEPGVYVSSVDALALGVLRGRGDAVAEDVAAVLGDSTAAVNSRTDATAWKEAADSAGDTLPEEMRAKSFLEGEYALVVLPNRIQTREEYWSVRRPGRGVKLDRANRSAVWEIIQTYRRRARLAGSIDWDESAAIAAVSLDAAAARPADHVLVDEGQDLTPTRWQFLRALVETGPDDLFIAEDSQQRIYGRQVVLGRYGIKIVGRSKRLTLNYRTTAENLAFAVGVLSGADYVDMEDVAAASVGYRSARRGPKPILRGAEGPQEELDMAAELVAAWIARGNAAETVAVLVRDARARDLVSRGLRDRGLRMREVDSGDPGTGMPVVMTMHRAKGTEFSDVLLFGVGASSLPNPSVLNGLSDSDRDDALLRERSLLYVAATRARDQLACTWSGARSPLLPQMKKPV
jgi:superfamily I DNA/RNA helicase